MLGLLQILATLLVAVAMGLALAHALELPGKMRLPRPTYDAVQAIYYPGFTIGGAIGEVGGLAALLLLMFFVPALSGAFWLVVCSFLALAAMHAVYWLLTHAVNDFWLKDIKLSDPGARFFRVGSLRRRIGNGPADWSELRNQWEYSHVIRAALGLLSLALLAGALVF